MWNPLCIFVNHGTDDLIVKSLSGGKVMRMVDVHYKDGRVTQALRAVNPNKDNNSKSNTRKVQDRGSGKVHKRKYPDWYQSDYRDRFIGTKTSIGTEITDIDDAHFFKRINERHGSPNRIENALSNPLFTKRGSNADGSTMYFSRNTTVVVLDNGNLKTFWNNRKTVKQAIDNGWKGEGDPGEYLKGAQGTDEKGI